ncbi:J domain-containing protein [Mycobacterium sp. SM1]|uniref:J domain-containing protein n=1 Tax=Mycobacterium sp. SM1 TaxID=2816243 RepID=UPI001BCD621D|nr:J domain-containing protein [Mycobacterium sp. SM1]MBS4729098.1 J domain-containing protein [Mycobacterium sp. SM1]
MTDPYTVLGVSPTATQAEITRAYRRQLRSLHPDSRRDTANSGADEKLREILAAYAVLRDPRRRAEYDRSARPVKDAGKPTGPIRIRVSRVKSGNDQPPLWAGPVRWHR